MPDANPTPPPVQPKTPAPPTQPQPSAAPTPPKKKTNVALIIIIVVVVLLVLGGGGVYLTLYLTGKAVKSTVSNLSSAVANISPTSQSPNAAYYDAAGTTTSEDPYKAAQDQTPTTGLAKQVNDEIKPILISALGDLRLESYADITQSGAGLKYVTKKNITQADYQPIENAFVSQGYTKQYGGVESAGYTLSVTKGNLTLAIGTFTDEPQRINVTASSSQ